MPPTDEPEAARARAARPRWSDVLRALREARGVTQEGWAAQLGVSGKTVQRWEHGERVPDPGAEIAILNYCRERDLFRTYDRGPLASLSVSAALLQELLAEARWRVGDATRVATIGPADASPRVVPRTPPSNLPAPLTSFVGREQEIAAVRRVLGGTRLLTLTGAGGCGKTRLALQVADELLWAYPHGVWFVELAALTDATLVPRAVARAFGLQPHDPQPPLDLLQEFLQPRGLLLLLDNCEHLLAACAALAEPLLRACPQLEVLATSRAPLGIVGESVWQVPPLALPPVAWELRDNIPHAADDEHPMLPDSVRLFVERARLHRPVFALTPQNAPAVAEVCRRLDGIPLAIELAAARVKVLSAEQIAARLSDRFQLLTHGGRTALPRHQTLRATLDWSHDLLTAPEQALLRRLAVCAGGFTLEAAEAVGADDGAAGVPGGDRAPDVLDLLAQLVDKSLVIADERDGVVRYRMLETVRQYAAEQLDAAGEARASRERHAQWCLALAKAAAAHWSGPEQGAWLERLAVEHDNIRAALGWCLADEGDVPVGLRLAGAVSWLWVVRGHLGEGRRWLAALLARGGAAPPQVRAPALEGAAMLASDQGDYDAAVHLHEQSLALRRELGDEAGVGRTLGNLGIVLLARGDLAPARVLFEESLAVLRRLGHRRNVANTLMNLGIVARRQGEHARSAALHAEALALMRELGDARGVALTLLNLGDTHRDQDALDQAWTRYRESLSLHGELQDRLGAAFCLEGLAMIAAARGDMHRTARLCGAAAALRAAIGAPLAPPGRARFDRATAAARAALGEADFVVAWAAGQALSLEEATAEALADATRA